MTDTAKPLTGRKVLLITLAAFGTILAANIALMVSAIGTFPGLEVKNSYVASQRFNSERAAQRKLGWTTAVTGTASEVIVTLRDKAGKPVFPAKISLRVGRLTHNRDDQVFDLTYSGGAFRAPAMLAPGAWEARLSATAADGTKIHQRFKFLIGDGS